MYEFHYGFMKNNVSIFKLLYSDTDSFIYEIGEDFYEIMYKHKEVFDLSNQPKDSKYYCNDNKKVPGNTDIRIYRIKIKKVVHKIMKKIYLRDIILILVITKIMVSYNVKKLSDIK